MSATARNKLGVIRVSKKEKVALEVIKLQQWTQTDAETLQKQAVPGAITTVMYCKCSLLMVFISDVLHPATVCHLSREDCLFF